MGEGNKCYIKVIDNGRKKKGINKSNRLVNTTEGLP